MPTEVSLTPLSHVSDAGGAVAVELAVVSAVVVLVLVLAVVVLVLVLVLAVVSAVVEVVVLVLVLVEEEHNLHQWQVQSCHRRYHLRHYHMFQKLEDSQLLVLGPLAWKQVLGLMFHR